MSTLGIFFRVAISAAIAGGTLIAQTAIAPVGNSGRLVSTIGVDRSVYFPGEEAVLTLTARNAGSAPLEVVSPFSAFGCFELSRLAPTGSLIPIFARPVCPLRLVEPTGAKVVLGAGEESRVSVSGDDLWPGSSASTVSGTSGYYQISGVSGASAVFRIAMPRLETATAVRIHDIVYTDPATRSEVRKAAYMHVFSLRWNNQSYLCIALSPSLRDKAVATDGTGNVTAVGVPYRRLAVLPGPVASLTGTANAQDNLAITWEDTRGASQTVLVAGDQGNGASDNVQVALDSSFERLSSADTQQFSAKVAGAANRNVTWSVSLAPGAPAGAQAGAVTASGVYTAPAGITKPYAAIVTAQSQADPSRSAVGVVALQPRNQGTLAAAAGDGSIFAAKSAVSAASGSGPGQ
ncbi:MAG: hypothetical protein ABSH42_11550 [Bryobacteraceae bacterium]|jgi:hypothetical protein